MLINNLFSIFDPRISIFSISMYLSILTLRILIIKKKWLNNIKIEIINIVLKIFIKEINLLNKNFMKIKYLFLMSLFFIIFSYNICSLFPFIFSVTSHLSINIPLSYIIWITVTSINLFLYFKKFFIHLVPVGTPIILINIIVIIELLRNIIRPLALTFRLTANMIAGHLLLSLIGTIIISIKINIIIIRSIMQIILITIEIGVSLIQAYVFSILILLYISEHYEKI